MESTTFRRELVRKCLHLLIAFIPFIARFNYTLSIALLIAGSLLYTVSEILRLHFKPIQVLANITRYASRPREVGKFVFGPLTLAAGAFLALIIFPLLSNGNLDTASVAILATAFGDALSGLVGRFLGRMRPKILCGKSIEGSVVCFFAVNLTTYAVLQDWRVSLATALVTVVVEALPLRSLDNIAIPLASGAASTLALSMI